jgi:hypothetical protein
MSTEKIFSKTNIGPNRLAECGLNKEEFIARLVVEHPIYNATVIDYNDETGELVLELEEKGLS